ncbi:hypothetical protein IFR05_001622 [Cadophora sp. M221]|nr:hypothetical protein IFR05_001622 [Cadophora sp. M221]
MSRAANRARQRKKKAECAAAAAASTPTALGILTAREHELQLKLGHVFADPTILLEALQAAGNGVSRIGERKIEDGNKRLAMLGDSVLSLAFLRDWFKEDESRKSGDATLAAVSGNSNLDQCGRACGLSEYINKHKSFANGVVPHRTMSDTVEALIGAVFLDSEESFAAVKVAMRGLGLLGA